MTQTTTTTRLEVRMRLSPLRIALWGLSPIWLRTRLIDRWATLHEVNA